MMSERMRKRTVNGRVGIRVGDEERISPARITVRLTVNERGKRQLSLALDDVGAVAMIPLEAVSDMLRVVPEGERP